MSGRIPIHGQDRRGARTPEYRAWADMVQRCTNPKNKRFKTYGARRIQVCDRWLKFENFFADMGLRSGVHHSIHRINNDQNYEPGNCMWATAKEQARNRTSNRILEFNGKSATLAEWSEITGINYDCLAQRINKLGWSASKALTTPKRNFPL